MEDAGLPPDGLDLETRRELGVILGTGGGGIAFVEELYGYYYKGQLEKATALAVPAGDAGQPGLGAVDRRWGSAGPRT